MELIFLLLWHFSEWDGVFVTGTFSDESYGRDTKIPLEHNFIFTSTSKRLSTENGKSTANYSLLSLVTFNGVNRYITGVNCDDVRRGHQSAQ